MTQSKDHATTQPAVRRAGWVRWAVAVVTTALALGVRELLNETLGEQAPLLIFTLSVMASALYAGWGPGLLPTALGAFAGVFFFIEPRNSLRLDEPADVVHCLLFLTSGGLISWLCESLHTARRRAEASEQDARVRLAEREEARA